MSKLQIIEKEYYVKLLICHSQIELILWGFGQGFGLGIGKRTLGFGIVNKLGMGIEILIRD